MSKLKLILSVLLMLLLLLVAIFLPEKYREQKETQNRESQNESISQEETEETRQPEELTKIDFMYFEELSQFFSSAQAASLKAQFPVYLTKNGYTHITSAEYLPNETNYPDTTTVELHFLLSDDSTLSVFYDTMTGVFSFGPEQMIIDVTEKTYEKPVDEDLPFVSTEDVNQRQEGGYADVSSSKSQVGKEVQP